MVVVVEFRVDDSFEKWPYTVDEGHHEEGSFDSVQVVEEVFGQFPIEVVEEEVASEGEDDDEEHEEDHERQVDFVSKVKTHHGVEVPERQEGEEFDVAFQTHLEEKAPE